MNIIIKPAILASVCFFATLVAGEAFAAELKCKVEISFFKTPSTDNTLSERRGQIDLIVLGLPASVILQPISTAGDPVEFKCDVVNANFKCIAKNDELTLSIEPAKIFAVRDRFSENPAGRLRDIYTCRFLKSGETALGDD